MDINGQGGQLDVASQNAGDTITANVCTDAVGGCPSGAYLGMVFNTNVSVKCVKQNAALSCQATGKSSVAWVRGGGGGDCREHQGGITCDGNSHSCEDIEDTYSYCAGM